jgi:hypothetical protein
MSGHRFGGLAWAAIACGSLLAAAADPAVVTPLVVTLELASGDQAAAADGSGTAPSGRLEWVSAETVCLATDDGPREFPVGGVRRLDLAAGPAAEGPPAGNSPRIAEGVSPPSSDGASPPSSDGVSLPSSDGVSPPSSDGVSLTLVGGGRISGDRFLWLGDTAELLRSRRGEPPTAVEVARVPIDMVDLVSWSTAAAPGAEATPPDWLESLPERPEGDVVVVRRPDGIECVECAILEVNDEHVVVMLDGERIPVRRDRVAGLRWLRPAAPPPAGRIDVLFTGGRIAATTATWSPERLVIDGRIVLPAGWLRAIDFTAGRTVRLTTLEPERVEVRPLLEGTADSPRLTAFLAPRQVPSSTGSEGEVLVVRPRTVMVWRVPPDSRVFRVRAVAAAGHTTLAIGVDEREPLRRELVATAGSPAECVLEIDVAAGRRLSLMVDVPPDDVASRGARSLGGPVRLERATFEP